MSPPSIYGFLGQLFAALSIFALLRHSLEFGLSEAFAIIISVYVHAVDLTIGQLDPAIKIAIAFLNNLFSWKMSFSEIWRYIFIVLQMLFIRDATTAYSDGRKVLSFVRLTVGAIISFISALAIAAISTNDPLVTNILISISVPIALLFYDATMYVLMTTAFYTSIGLGELQEPLPRKKFLQVGLQRSAFRFAIVSLPSLSLFFIPQFRSATAPGGGVVVVIFGTLVNVAYWLKQAADFAKRESNDNIKYRKAFLASEYGRFALAVLSVLFWCFVFLTVNAGARILSL
ncbi:hypothetical protein [Thiorhodococcus fuscus]|uniref:Uncharacterized protein n=1 Tax=Thiorhodococcus fuscus TaxID=527200 RepID=A0ABW4Y6Q6_9GAMM